MTSVLQPLRPSQQQGEASSALVHLRLQLRRQWVAAGSSVLHQQPLPRGVVGCLVGQLQRLQPGVGCSAPLLPEEARRTTARGEGRTRSAERCPRIAAVDTARAGLVYLNPRGCAAARRRPRVHVNQPSSLVSTLAFA